MNLFPTRHHPYKRHQQGQAMVEYAILFLVLSILFIGGAELGMAALASYKNTDAAKTGISEYAEVNQRRLNILNTERQYLLNLSSHDSCIKINQSGDCDNAGSHESYVKYLDAVFTNDGHFEDVFLYLQSNADTNPGTNTPSEIISAAGTITLLLDNENDLINTTVTSTEEGQLKYRAMLLLSHYKLSTLPVNDTNVGLSMARLIIGDHASSGYSQPACNAGNNTYNYGFPDLNNDGIEDRYHAANQTGTAIYFFNPLPIDLQSCVGNDGTRSGRSRLSILVSGYGNPGDALYEPGLPKLNQAMYGMYKKDLNGRLIPPGKMCIDEDCPNQDLILNGIGPTGYFRWGKGSDSDERFKYKINDVEADLLNFRPAMQLDCSHTSNADSPLIYDGSNCNEQHAKVRLHTRYRKLFEGFLGFGIRELDPNGAAVADALKLFYNPNNVGISNQINGTIDSEIGPLGRNGLPSVKQFKDFRGCYEVDVETNQVSACN